MALPHFNTPPIHHIMHVAVNTHTALPHLNTPPIHHIMRVAVFGVCSKNEHAAAQLWQSMLWMHQKRCGCSDHAAGVSIWDILWKHAMAAASMLWLQQACYGCSKHAMAAASMLWLQ